MKFYIKDDTATILFDQKDIFNNKTTQRQIDNLAFRKFIRLEISIEIDSHRLTQEHFEIIKAILRVRIKSDPIKIILFNTVITPQIAGHIYEFGFLRELNKAGFYREIEPQAVTSLCVSLAHRNLEQVTLEDTGLAGDNLKALLAAITKIPNLKQLTIRKHSLAAIAEGFLASVGKKLKITVKDCDLEQKPLNELLGDLRKAQYWKDYKNVYEYLQSFGFLNSASPTSIPETKAIEKSKPKQQSYITNTIHVQPKGQEQKAPTVTPAELVMGYLNPDWQEISDIKNTDKSPSCCCIL